MDGTALSCPNRVALRASLRVQREYHTSTRIDILKAFRHWRCETERLLEDDLSSADIDRMIDEAFSRYHDWMSDKHSPNFKAVFNDRLDPKTIKALLTCELSYKRVRRFAVHQAQQGSLCMHAPSQRDDLHAQTLDPSG